MAYVNLVSNDGRVLSLGKFNEGKKTDSEIALAAARKFRNMIGRLECGGYKLVVIRTAGQGEVPIESFRGKL